MNVQNMNTVTVFVFVLITGLMYSRSPAQNQTDPKAKQTLKESAVNSFNASSYKMKMEQTINQSFNVLNRSNSQNNTINATYEKPYIHVNSSVDSGLGKNGKLEYLGKVDRDAGEMNMFLRSSFTGNKWQKMNNQSQLNLHAMFKRFKNPEELPKRLEQINFAGEEVIEGTECITISAKQKEDVLKQTVENLLKGRLKKLGNLELNIEKSDITYWIGTSSNRIEKIQADTSQVIQFRMNAGKQNRTMKIDQKVKMTIRFSDYENTTIDDELKQKYKELSNSSAGDGGDSDEGSGDAETF